MGGFSGDDYRTSGAPDTLASSVLASQTFIGRDASWSFKLRSLETPGLNSTASRSVAGIVTVALVLFLTAAAFAASSDAASKSVVVEVRPSNSLLDQALSISVSHLDPGERITLSLSSKDSRGFLWLSSATFVANRSGVVNPATDPSLGGSYKGTWPMGLISTMSSSGREPVYFWGDGAQDFLLSVEVSKREIATTTFTRRLNSLHVSIKSETLAGEGFVGNYFDPARSMHVNADPKGEHLRLRTR